LTAAIVRTALAAAVALAPAAASRAGQPASPVRILDVPYVLQSEELCGGAAAAMVMRFFGATGIYAESFSPLVDKAARGIKGADLIRSLHDRGWQAVSFTGDRQLIERSLEQRHPPIALIEVRPGRFHYVVVLSWSSGRVVVHDPARKPFDVRDEAEFLRAWNRSGRWTLVALPASTPAGTSVAAPAEQHELSSPAPGPCGTLVEEAVRLANRGEMDVARRALEQATAQCPGDPAGWRELAGLDALNKDWPRAALNARRALSVDGGDRHAARILATSLFLEGDTLGALRAWNRAGEPALDLVDVRGLERTRYAVALNAMRLHAQARLTPSMLTRAARRLDAVPALAGSSVSYTPKDEGLAQVTGAVIERPVLPANRLAAAAVAVRAGTDREVAVNAASLAGGGELWRASWRWWENRPRLAFGLAAPAPFGGVWEIAFVNERETYGRETSLLQQQRRTVSLSFADWATGTIRWEAGIMREQWPGDPATGGLAGIRYQTMDDRLSASARTAVWSQGGAEWLTSAGLEWRSRVRNQGTVLLGRLAASAASAGTPLLSWNGAGSGQGRDELLRAHPLLHDGVIRDAVFGRSLLSGGVEWRRWSAPFKRVLRVAPAVFADTARAYDVPDFADRRAHLDVGAGLRLAIPGAGILRSDLAVGARDGNVAFSVGWVR
jgi:hypothetical protein